MYFRKSPIILLACLAVVGCRRDRFRDVYFEMLNAEKRLLEDRLYEAEYNYERALQELKACRSQVDGDRVRPATPKTQPARPEAPALPEIEFPPGFENGFGESSPPSPLRPASVEVPVMHDGRTAGGPEPGNDRLDAPPVDLRVVAISLGADGTGAMDLDGTPGDDALSVLIEPRNELEQYVAKPGRVNIVLLDPAAEGEAARFAQWEFDQPTTRRMLSTSRFERGIHVRVPLPELPSEADRLHLFVRYTDDDGRSVEADRIIEVRSTVGRNERWTPRADAEVASPVRAPEPTARPVPPAPDHAPATPPRLLFDQQHDFWKPHR